MRYLSQVIFMIFLSLILVSCSGQPASLPDIDENAADLSAVLSANYKSSPTHLWGMYDVCIDPATKEAVVLLDRQAASTVNVVKFLNDKPLSMQVNVVNVINDSNGTTVYVDVIIIHPFPGMPEFNGYDVRGVFMGNGSGTLAYNPALKYPIYSDDQSIQGTGAELVDYPDGYTRWYNQPEFSTGGMPIFSYTQGNMATQGYSPTATLCPYHYYADGLGATDNASDWLEANPGLFGRFQTGSANTRRFAVRFPTTETKFRFGYAVIACWQGTAPGDHPSNADEAIAADAIIADTLYYESPSSNGGDLTVDFTLYAWKGFPTSIIIESTVLSTNHTLTPAEMAPVDIGSNYLTWHVEIPADNVQDLYGNEFWVIAEYANSDYKNNAGTVNLAGDDPLAAFFRFDLPISSECGLLAWAKKAGGQLIDRSRGITTLSDDSVVATGEFSQVFPPSEYEYIPATFGLGEPNETTLIDPKYGNIFMARYNADDGSLAWAKGAGGSGYDSGISITTLSDDSTVVTGFFGATSYSGAKAAVFGEDETNETELECTNAHGSFYIAKYNPDGTLAWAKRAIGEPYYNQEHTQRGHAVTALSDDSIIVAGVFANHATFGEGEPTETKITYDPYYWDIFIACYNPDGTLAWARRDGGTELEKPLGITTLPNDNFVITGEFGTQDVKPATFGCGDPNQTSLYTVGRFDIFIACYDSDGALEWAKRAGGAGPDSGLAITALSDNSVVITGSYGNGGDPGEFPCTFGLGEPNETTLAHAGWDDIFIARYNSDGTLAWAKRAAGESQDKANGIATLSDDRFAIAGEFWEPCTFGEGEPGEITLIPYPNSDPNFSYDDIFVAWYNPDGTVSCATSSGGKSYDLAYACTSLSDDSVVASGDFAGTYGATFGLGEDNEVTYYGQSIEMFVARYWE